MRRPLALALSSLLVAGCASNDGRDPADPPPGPPPATDTDREWASPGYHLAGLIPAGWAQREREDAIVAMTSGNAEITLKVATVDAMFVRPDEDVLCKVLEPRWKKSSTCMFDLFQASAARGDFTSGDGSSASTHVMWEWLEGAPPGKKFIFHAAIVCPPGDHAGMQKEFEKFVDGLSPDFGGPDVNVPVKALAAGWTATSLPRKRTVLFAGCAIPAADDPFVKRDVPLSAWYDARDKARDRRLKGEKLSDEEAWNEALAHYNIALQMLWSQLGAPNERRDGARFSPREYLQSFGRMEAAVALNLALVIKLRAERDGKPWMEAAHLKWNATVLEAAAVELKTGDLDGETRENLHDAAAAPLGEYRSLALAWWKELEPGAVEKAVGSMETVRKAFAERRWEDAEEAAREALAATDGQWAEAHRAIAAANFEAGRLQNAAGAARNALAALPGAPSLMLEDAEILLAAGRADEALVLLDMNDGLIRDSLQDNAVVLHALRAVARQKKGDTAGSKSAVGALLKIWRESGASSIAWDFGPLSRAMGDAEPMKEQLAAMTALLGGKGSPESVERAWQVDQ